MGRCILVFCLPRSGSSALAGALHRMGVDMGEGFLQKPDALNPKGYYEDLRWHGVNKALSGYSYAIWEPVRMTAVVEKRLSLLLDQLDDKPLWGFKSPRLAFTASHIIPYIERRGHDVRVILTHRPFDQVVDSMRRHSQKAYGGQHRLTQRAAETMMTRWMNALKATIDWFVDGGYPSMQVTYSDLVDAPKMILDDVRKVVYGGLDLPMPNIAEAIQWIAPEMRHFK